MLNDFEIFQNKALGSLLIWEFIRSYQLKSPTNSNPSIFHVLIVLPICLNKRIVAQIKNRQTSEGSLQKAISENRDLFIGLADRIEYFSPLSFQCIHFGNACNLFKLGANYNIHLKFKSFPLKLSQTQKSDYKDMSKTAKRLGSWCAVLSFSEIIYYFNLIE